MPRLKLTDAFVQGAKCPGEKAQEDYRDIASKGLTLRVSKTGRKVWSFLYSLDGKERRLTLGEYGKSADKLTLVKARQEAEALRVQIRLGADPAKERDTKKEKRQAEAADSVESVLERRIRKLIRDGRREKYIADMRGRLKTHVLPKIGNKPISQITEGDVRAILDPLEMKGQASTHNRVLVMLRPLFSFAKVPDPTLNIDHLPEAAKEARFTLEEIASLWRAFENPTSKIHPLSQIALKLATLTLKRSGECAGAAFSELDSANSIWNIPAARMKGKRAESVPLSEAALKLFEEAAVNPFRPADEEKPKHLFPSPRDHKRPVLQPSLSKAFTRAKKVADLADHEGTLHSLRHSGATMLAASGVSPYVVSALLSHSPSATGIAAVSGRYNAYDLLNERRASLQTYANWIADELSGANRSTSNILKISESKRGGQKALKR
ncbi:MAG: tyrosine-type recombinase/integrase [Pseudomonadota bacterium]